MDNDQKPNSQLLAFITIPFVLGVPPVLGWFIGSYLDKLMGTKPFMMYIFIILGFASGFLEFYKMVKRFGDKP